MRILTVSDVKLYEIFYEAMLTPQTRGAETRTLAKIQTKIEKLGTQKPDTLLFTLAENGTIELEDAEYALAQRFLNEVQWNAVGAKAAADLMDWFESAPTKEQYEALQRGVLTKV